MCGCKAQHGRSQTRHPKPRGGPRWLARDDRPSAAKARSTPSEARVAAYAPLRECGHVGRGHQVKLHTPRHAVRGEGSIHRTRVMSKTHGAGLCKANGQRVAQTRSLEPKRAACAWHMDKLQSCRRGPAGFCPRAAGCVEPAHCPGVSSGAAAALPQAQQEGLPHWLHMLLHAVYRLHTATARRGGLAGSAGASGAL